MRTVFRNVPVVADASTAVGVDTSHAFTLTTAVAVAAGRTDPPPLLFG